jgi:hypothetical protein
MPPPGMTAGNPFEGQPKAFKKAIFFKSLNGIIGTTGGEPAAWADSGRNDPLIDLDQRYQWQTQYAKNGLHLVVAFTSFCKATPIFVLTVS